MSWAWRRWLVGIQWFNVPVYHIDKITMRRAFYLYLGPLRLGREWETLWWSKGGDAVRPF